MTRDFGLLIRVRYSECDAQQVVFNARYADYADLAATEFVRHALGGYQQLLEQGLDTQVVNLTLNWMSPARFDDVLLIEVKTERTGTTSYTLKMRMTRHPDEVLLAECQVTYVLVNTHDYQKCPIPSDLKDKLMTGAPEVLVNQAG